MLAVDGPQVLILGPRQLRVSIHMARMSRLAIAGYPHHLIQRGNNRVPIFKDPEDYQRYRALLGEGRRATTIQAAKARVGAESCRMTLQETAMPRL